VEVFCAECDLLLLGFFNVRVSHGAFIRIGSLQSQKREEEAINKSMQLQFLQSQLNPHFLFNTINDIYALALKKSDQTPETLMQLSGLLRYALYDNKEMTVPLQKELTYINNYLNLQRTGYENLFYVDLEIEGDPASWQIPPMLLLPFVENACKHGVTNEKNNPVVIRICSGTKNYRSP
jgi:two-component system LytT family sensor kinase